MERMYLADLENATEIVLRPRRMRPRAVNEPIPLRDMMSGGRGSASRAAAGALRIGRTVGAALTDQRVLAATEARLVGTVGLVLLAAAVVGILWPLVLVVPLAIILIWMAIALLVRAYKLRRARRSQGLPTQRIAPAAAEPGPKAPQ